MVKLIFLLLFFSAETNAAESTAILELETYLRASVLSEEEDPVKWWYTQGYKFPYLNILAKEMMCVVATSVPCERVFSKAGMILNERRTRLSTTKTEKLVFLNSNMKQ